MKNRISLIPVALCLLLAVAGCNQKNTSDDAGSYTEVTPRQESLSGDAVSEDLRDAKDEGATHPLYQAIVGSREEALEFVTDITQSGGLLITPTADLAREVANTLSIDLLRQQGDEISFSEAEGYLSYMRLEAKEAPAALVELYRYGPDHPQYPEQALGFLTLEGGEQTVITVDPVTYDIVYNLLDVASYSPEVPAEEFVVPLQQIIASYQEGGIGEEQREWFEPLPEGATLPEVKSVDDFTVYETEGTFPYMAVMPMDGGIDMQAAIIFFDETGWGVGSVKFVDRVKS